MLERMQRPDSCMECNVKGNDMRSNPFLLVGFGGAGLRTLDAFDAMVAANSSHAHQLRENIYYFAVDTEQAAIQAFQESILRRSNGARGPYTTTCCLSENIQNFDEIVRPVFDRFYGRPNDVGLSRLREHWWFDADGRPFRGRDGLNVMYGSGMSPVVAFTLAWHQMRMIEEKVGEILDNIKRRSMACMGPISRMRIYFVTSLAGGTGRGSWAPVMLKIKEVFSDRGCGYCRTTGLFFDASIFGDFIQGAPSEALTYEVNSLTGLSELSFWIGDNMRGMCEVPIPFGLPDMMSPANPEKDVLKFGEEKFLCSRSPVDNAYLICRQSSACGRLDSHNDYFQMAGRGLFALYEQGDIEAMHINDLRMIRSFAITALTVDVVGLRAYFNYLARKSVLDEIISECDDVGARVDEFLKRIFFPPAIREESDIRPDLNGTLMQRACANLNASKGEEYSRLRKQLSLLQSKRASSGVQSLSRSVVDSVTEIDVNNAVSLAVESLRARFNGKGLDLRRELVSEVCAICMGDEGEKLSVGRVRKFLQQLLQKMDGLTNSSITEFSFSDPLAPDSVDKLSAREWIDRVFYKFSKRTLLEAIMGRSPFNADKVSELVHESDSGWGGLVPRVVLCDIYPKLREKLLDFFEPLQTLVHAILDSCDSVLAWSEKADALLSKRLMCEVGCRTHEELFHRIFTTPDRMFEELPSVDSMAIHCQTILKPIVRDCQEVNELLLKSDNIKYYKCRIGDLLLNALNCCTDDGPRLRGDGGVHEESMAEEDIFEAIIDNVNVSDSFVEKRFSLFKVLTRNREYWNCQIMIMAGDCHATNIFNDKLRALLGVMPKRSGAGELYELPSAEDLLISATCMLVQRCQPWWNVGCDAVRTNCYVTVPELASEKHQHYLDVIRSRLDRHVTVLARQSYENVDPYSVVAFVVQDVPSERREDGHIFNSIKSFDYWKTPEILEKLREAERADGKLIFSRGQHRGIGYMSPRFVQDPQLSSMRWKPWAETESKDEMTLRQTSNPIGGDTIDSARTNQSDVFISYSRRDLDVVKPIKEELERNGFSCWMDIDGIESGDENFKQKIVPAIDGCCVVLFFISAFSQKSEWTAKELGYAKRHGKRVVPLRFNDDSLVGVFDFDYGDADIIDWRRAEQRAKLLVNLQKRTQKLNDIEVDDNNMVC